MDIVHYLQVKEMLKDQESMDEHGEKSQFVEHVSYSQISLALFYQIFLL